MKRQTKTRYAVVTKRGGIFAIFDYEYDAQNYTVKDYGLEGKRVKKVKVTIEEDQFGSPLFLFRFLLVIPFLA
jgi:hypothetical protein